MKISKQNIEQLSKEFESGSVFKKIKILLLNPLAILVTNPLMLVAFYVVLISLFLIPFLGFYEGMIVAFIGLFIFSQAPFLPYPKRLESYLTNKFIL